jgi:hypothetical protein
MKIEDVQPAKVFRYETESGIAVETYSRALPVFNADDRSFDWYDLASVPLANLNSLRVPLQWTRVHWFSDDAILSFSSIRLNKWYGNYASTIELDFSAPNALEGTAIFVDMSASNAVNLNWLACIPDFYVATVVDERTQFSRKCLGKHENRLVYHKPGRSPLMAGKEYLVSRCEQERTEASAKIHVTHLEFLTLSRDHSNTNLFSAAIHRLSRFGWRIWRKYSSIFGSRSNFWPRFPLLQQLCPSFAIISSEPN